MEGGLASGWHISREGVTYGPYTWADMAAFSRDGRLSPTDLVWHQELPGWIPASRIPDLFPVATGAPGRSGGPAGRRWIWALAPAGVALIIVAAVLGSLWGTGVFSGGVPVAETSMEAATVIDGPYTLTTIPVSANEGARLEHEGLVLEVPAGALESDTTLEVKHLQGAFNMTEGAPPTGGTPHAVCASPVLDFGPEGTTFSEPVTITLPYEEALLPDGFPEERVRPAYWNGTAWVVLEASVDTSNNTVSLALREFDGITLTTLAVVGLGAIIAGEAVYIYNKAFGSDQITQGIAAQWIQDKDPVVIRMAQAAKYEGIPLKDEKALGMYLRNHAKPSVSVTFPGADGAAVSLQGRYSDGFGTNWQKPADYFTKGGMRGDCTDVTNALVSVFRALGYPAKAMFGYDADNAPHAWGEVLIDNKVYLIDEQGALQDRQKALNLLKLKRPSSWDRRNYMWDESGQEAQDPDWYRAYLTTVSTTGTEVSGTALDGTWVGTEEWSNGEEHETSDITVTFKITSEQYGTAQVVGGRYKGEHQASWFVQSSSVSVDLTEEMQVGGYFQIGDTEITLAAQGEGSRKVVWKLKRPQ
jgi:hypothetical protein